MELLNYALDDFLVTIVVVSVSIIAVNGIVALINQTKKELKK